MTIKIGEPDPHGSIVNSVLGQSASVAVYTTTDEQLRWNYTANNGTIPATKHPAISKFDSLMSEIKTVAPPKYKQECFALLGKALFAALDTDAKGVDPNTFESLEIFLHRLAQQRTRTSYVFLCMFITAVSCTAALLVIHNAQTLHVTYFYAAVFGSIGACISVMQRANNIDIDWTLDHLGLALQAISRISLGALFGAIFVIACKYQILLGAFAENIGALYLFAMVAGFSERMIPELFERLEIKAEEST